MGAKRVGSRFGFLDLIILYMIASSGLYAASSSGGDIGMAVVLFGLFSFWFAWRRGWIQRYLAHRKAEEEAARRAEKRARAAAGEALSVAPQPMESTDTNEPAQIPAARFVISVPAGEKWQAGPAVGLLRALHEKAGQGWLAWGIEGTAAGVYWTLEYGSSQRQLTQPEVENLVRAYYPGAQVRQAEIKALTLPVYRRYVVFKRGAVNYFDPALSALEIRSSDPLATVVQTLEGLREGEELHYELFVPEMVAHTPQQIEEVLTLSAFDADIRAQGGVIAGHGLGGIVAAGIINSGARMMYEQLVLKKERVLRYSEAETNNHLQKLQEPLFATVLSLLFETPDPARLSVFSAAASAVKGLSSETTRVIEGYTSPDLTIKTQAEWVIKTPLNYWTALLPDRPGDVDESEAFLFYLTAAEAAAFWHLPHQGLTTAGIDWAQRVPPEVLEPTEDGVVVGQVGSGSSAQAVHIKQIDRAYHSYITGHTGMGKSTLLHNLIHQDIAQGYGVMVLDPHGGLVRDVLTTSIPPERTEDVVYLEVGNTNYPVPLNPLRVVGDISQESVFNTVLWIMKSIYAASWSETLMETTFRNILQVLLSDEQATPLDIQELVENEAYRRRIVSRAQQSGQLSRATTNFWMRFEQASSSRQSNQTQSILNRLGAFLGSKSVELMTCHPRALDFRQLIRERKIVLVDLSGDAITSEVDSLGAIFLAQVFLASIALGENPSGQPPRFYLFVDETQRFITTAIPNMFSEARKFGLSLTLANQYIGQLDQDTQAGISNNVGTKFAFEAVAEEAVVTAKLYEPEVQAQDIQKLGVGRAALRTRANGKTLPGFIVNTPRRPQGYEALPQIEALKQRSRERLGLLTAAEVVAWLDQRYEGELFAPSRDEEITLTDFDTDDVDETAETPQAEVTPDTSTEPDAPATAADTTAEDPVG